MVQLYVTYKKFTLSLGEKSIKMRNQRNRYDNGKRKRKKSQPNLYQINYVLVKKRNKNTKHFMVQSSIEQDEIIPNI